MRQVITIDIHGRLYQLEQQGYEDLRAYLDRARARLGANPDKAEILRDLEQSTAEKLERCLAGGRNVVAAAEVAQILAEIGPVEGADVETPRADARGATDAAGATARAEAAAPPRRLYLIQEGAMIGGVCNGIAAYFSLDPTFVRIAFVALAFAEIAYLDRPPALSLGVYVLLMFLVPSAASSSESTRAAGAHEPLARKLQRRVERVKAAFGGLQRNAH